MAKKSESTTPTLQSFIGENTKILIKLAWSTVAPAYTKATQKVAKKIKADGFRQGKVPAELAEKLAGTEKIIDEALQILLPEAYQAAVQAEKKQPLTYPEFKPVKVEKNSEWIIEAQLAERPKIEVKNYKRIASSAKKEADKKIIQSLKDHKHEENDKDHDHAHHEPTEEQRRDYQLQHVYQALVQEFKPVIPELLVKHEVQADLDQLTQQLSQANLSFDDYLARRKMTFEQVSQEMTINALGKLQVAFLLDAVSQEANITIADKEIDEYIAKKIDDKIRTEFGTNPEYRRLLANTLLRQKIADHLLAA